MNVLNVPLEYRDRQNLGAGAGLGRRPGKMPPLMLDFEELEWQRTCVKGD